MAGDEQQQDDTAAGAAAADTSAGDSRAETTPAPAEAKTPSVPKAGDQFPWEFRCQVPDADGEMVDTAVPCIAEITSVSRDLVWCWLQPKAELEPKHLAVLRRVIGFPRHIHVMMADARKALGLPAA